MYSAYQRALGYFEQNMDDVNWKKNFNSSTQIDYKDEAFPDIRLTVESMNFDDSSDTYGFLNIYARDMKITHPFKKIDLTPEKKDYSFFVRNTINDPEALNTGGSLSVDSEKPIYLPSSRPLVFNVNFLDISDFSKHFSPEHSRIFHTGFDKYGIFSILRTGPLGIGYYRSRFRLSGFSFERSDLLKADLVARMLEWEKRDEEILLKKTQTVDISSYEIKTPERTKSDTYYSERATRILPESKKIPTYSYGSSMSGIHIFKKLEFERSRNEFSLGGRLCLITSHRLSIGRNIVKANDFSMTSFVLFNQRASDILLNTEKIQAFIYSDITPSNIKNLTITGNLVLNHLDKTNLKEEMTVRSDFSPSDCWVVSISPVINYYTGLL